MKRSCNNLLATIACGLLFIAVPRAQFVAGQVVDDQGQGVVDVELRFSDGLTPPLAISGFGGFFNVAVPDGEYDIGFIPPTDLFAPQELQSVSVSGATNLGVIVLDAGFLLTGTVLTTDDQPVTGGNIDVFEYQSGDKLFTPGDGIDLLGAFDVVVPAGIYRLRAKPPVGELLVTRDIGPINVTAPTALPPIVLAPGFFVTGRVSDAQTQLPIPDVDLDVDDSRTGNRLITPGDNTDDSGEFGVVLPAGRVDISFDPPSGSRHIARTFFDITITGPIDLGAFTLQAGLLITGSLVGPGQTPVVNSDIDLLADPSGATLPLSNDNTDSNGNFAVAVSPGRYRLRFDPRLSDRLLGSTSAAFDLTSDLMIPTTQLLAGIILSGSLRGFDGQPEGGADIDLIDPLNGAKASLTRDNSNGAGLFALVVPPGNWNIRFQTEKASPSRSQTLDEQSLQIDSVIDHSLPLVPVFAYLNKPASLISIADGGLLTAVVAIANLGQSYIKSMVSLVLIDPDGGKIVLFAPTLIFIPNEVYPLADPRSIFERTPLRAFQVRLPHIDPNHLGNSFRLELRVDDPETGEEFDRDSFRVIIQ